MASNSEDAKIPSSSEDIEEDKKTDEPATQNATPSGESTTSSDQATPPGEGPALSSHSSGTGRGTGANMGVSSQQKIIQTLSSEGHDSMFAITPKRWCEHLPSHVKPLPPGGIDSTLPCETCGASPEVWVCLTCYRTYCSRYVKEHMVVHQETSGHKMALSMADLSVWCYLCDSYLDNHILQPAINSAHKSKFGCYIDGSS